MYLLLPVFKYNMIIQYTEIKSLLGNEITKNLHEQNLDNIHKVLMHYTGKSSFNRIPGRN